MEFKSKAKHPAPAQRVRSSSNTSPASVRQIRRSEIQNILRSTGAQAKLTIGAPNDKYEQEADRVADQVMRMSDADVAQRVESGTVQPMSIQRLAAGDEEDEVQAKFSDEYIQRQEGDDEETVRAKESPGQIPQVSSNSESKINSLKGGGEPLDMATRSFFEPRFGQDFSQVRIHAGSHAADTAKSVNARAFALGNHVVMNSGEYQPQTAAGKRLLGHELTHVVQQGGSRAMKQERRAQSQTLSPPGMQHESSAPAGMIQQQSAIAFTPLVFTPAVGGAMSAVPLVSGTKVQVNSAAVELSGSIMANYGTDAEAQAWELGFIQTAKKLERKAHYGGSTTKKLRTAAVTSPVRDALVSNGEPWYDPNNTNVPGRVLVLKTDSLNNVGLWDRPRTVPSWDTPAPDTSGKLHSLDGKDSFVAWMVARKKTSPNEIKFLNWASWEVNYGVAFDYYLTGKKTVGGITGTTSTTGSGTGKGSDSPVLSGATANDSFAVTWS